MIDYFSGNTDTGKLKCFLRVCFSRLRISIEPVIIRYPGEPEVFNLYRVTISVVTVDL